MDVGRWTMDGIASSIVHRPSSIVHRPSSIVHRPHPCPFATRLCRIRQRHIRCFIFCLIWGGNMLIGYSLRTGSRAVVLAALIVGVAAIAIAACDNGSPTPTPVVPGPDITATPDVVMT